MTNALTCNQLSGRATGAIFFAVFGSLWIFLALYAKELLSPATIFWLAMDLVVLLAGAIWLKRQAKRFTAVPQDPAMSKTFNRVNLIQWIAVAIVVPTFNHFHLEAYVMCAITLIVGLHLFPLARLFHYPLHHVTGALLTIWAILSACIVPADHLQGASAMGTGIILLASAFTTLIMAGTAVRRAGLAYAAR